MMKYLWVLTRDRCHDAAMMMTHELRRGADAGAGPPAGDGAAAGGATDAAPSVRRRAEEPSSWYWTLAKLAVLLAVPAYVFVGVRRGVEQEGLPFQGEVLSLIACAPATVLVVRCVEKPNPHPCTRAARSGCCPPQSSRRTLAATAYSSRSWGTCSTSRRARSSTRGTADTRSLRARTPRGRLFRVRAALRKGCRPRGRRPAPSLAAGIFSGPAADSIDGLTPSEAEGLFNWLEFYKKDYTYVGKLAGTYFDARGAPTAAWAAVEELRAVVETHKDQQAALTKQFPPCDMTFTNGAGGRVWCATNSGGIKREWVRPGAGGARAPLACASLIDAYID